VQPLPLTMLPWLLLLEKGISYSFSLGPFGGMHLITLTHSIIKKADSNLWFFDSGCAARVSLALGTSVLLSFLDALRHKHAFLFATCGTRDAATLCGIHEKDLRKYVPEEAVQCVCRVLSPPRMSHRPPQSDHVDAPITSTSPRPQVPAPRSRAQKKRARLTFCVRVGGKKQIKTPYHLSDDQARLKRGIRRRRRQQTRKPKED